MGDACVIGKLEDDLGDFKALSVRVIQFQARTTRCRKYGSSGSFKFW